MFVSKLISDSVSIRSQGCLIYLPYYNPADRQRQGGLSEIPKVIKQEAEKINVSHSEVA